MILLSSNSGFFEMKSAADVLVVSRLANLCAAKTLGVGERFAMHGRKPLA
jgi:hypothetical protein